MPFDPDDPRLTAYALGELDDADRAEVESALADDPSGRLAVEEIRATAQLLAEGLRREPSPGLAPEQREAIEWRLRRRWPRPWLLSSLGLATAAAALLAALAPWRPAAESERAAAVAARIPRAMV